MVFFKEIIIIFLMLIMTSSCTYSINMVHTQGSADDIVDENQKADADVKPNVNVSIPPI